MRISGSRRASCSSVWSFMVSVVARLRMRTCGPSPVGIARQQVGQQQQEVAVAVAARPTRRRRCVRTPDRLIGQPRLDAAEDERLVDGLQAAHGAQEVDLQAGIVGPAQQNRVAGDARPCRWPGPRRRCRRQGRGPCRPRGRRRGLRWSGPPASPFVLATRSSRSASRVAHRQLADRDDAASLAEPVAEAHEVQLGADVLDEHQDVRPPVAGGHGVRASA